MASVSPYEILGITPSASNADIMRAYQPALRQQRYAPAEVTRAFNELRNPGRRFEYDLFELCHLGDVAAVHEALQQLPATEFLPLEVDQLSSALAFVANPDMTADFGALPDCPMELIDNFDFPPGEAVLLPIPFPA